MPSPAQQIPAGRVILTYGRSLMALVIARSLAQRGVEVIGCDDVDLTVLSFSRHVRETFTVAPWKTQPEKFLDDLEAAVRDFAPRDGRPYVLMPVFEEIELISRNRSRFEPTVRVAAPTWDAISLVHPKDHLADLVERARLSAPQTWKVSDEATLPVLAAQRAYPLIVKPSEGAGGRGISLANSAAEAVEQVEALGFASTPLLQALAPGDDFCVAVLADKGRLAAMMAYRNVTTFPRKAGAGAVRETVDAEPFRAATEELLAAAGWDGLAELDFRWTGEPDSPPQLIEVNARFWAGIFHSIQTAVDFPWLLYLHTIGAPLENVGEPDIGARTKTPGVWLLAALEEVAASAPHLAEAGEAWREARRRLSEGQLAGLKDSLRVASSALASPETRDLLKAAWTDGKDAPSELSEDSDPLVGLGALFVLSSLIKHGKLPPEMKYDAAPTAPSETATQLRERPNIGVTMPDSGDFWAWQAMRLAVWLAGGKAVKLTARAPHDPRTIDGLIFGGGSDVYPLAFEGQPKTGYRYDLARGDMEASWGLAARRVGLPVLGICRGAQMLNVIAGGTLHMDLSGFEGSDMTPTPWEHLTVRKRLRLRPSSRLAQILVGPDELRVNSIHQQAIDRLGVGLTVAGREGNGVIQAIEDRTRRFWIGVQYHPELLVYRAVHRRLFKALVEAARERMRERFPVEPASAQRPEAS